MKKIENRLHFYRAFLIKPLDNSYISMDFQLFFASSLIPSRKYPFD